jgi:hypothetical protein
MKVLYLVAISFCSLALYAERPSPEKIQELAKKFAPEVRFHKEEKYFPSSIEWLAARSALKEREDDKVTTIKEKPVDASILKNYPPKGYPNSWDVNNYFLDPDKDMATRAGMPIMNGFSTSPCYYHVGDRSNGGLVIQYIFLYPHQGKLIPEEIAGISLPEKIGPFTFDIGMHEGDLEHVDVYLKKQGDDYVLDEVYYSAHGAKPFGELLWASQTPLTDGTHPIVYAAKFGHASHSYNVGFMQPGTLDSTSDGGPKWQCWKVPLRNLGDREKPAPGQEWILFGGRLGSTIERKWLLDPNLQFNNSPPGPAIDNMWWRTKLLEYLLTTIAVHAGSGRVSDYLDWTDVLPIRMRKIRWQIKHPQANDIQFHVNEYRHWPNRDRKDIYSMIDRNVLYNGDVTDVSKFKENIYIADVKSKSGAKIEGPITIEVIGLEE